MTSISTLYGLRSLYLTNFLSEDETNVHSQHLRPSSSYFSVSRRPTDLNFWHFRKKKSNDVVKPLFTWNNSFNLKNEHSNSIEQNRNKNRNIFYSILCILLIQIRKCKQFQRHSVVPGPPIPSLLVICFLFFFSIPQTYLISRNAFDTKRKKKGVGDGLTAQKLRSARKLFFSLL